MFINKKKNINKKNILVVINLFTVLRKYREKFIKYLRNFIIFSKFVKIIGRFFERFYRKTFSLISLCSVL